MYGLRHYTNDIASLIGEYGSIYLNPHGAACIAIDESERVVLEDCIYPAPEYNHISIKKWPYGSHFYAYVNGKQIYDELGHIKWNTEKRAREVAENYVRRLNE